MEEPEKHDDYLRFLIDYYVGKTFQKVEPLGFLSGKPGTKTYGIRGASRSIFPLVDRLKDERMHVRFMKNEETRQLDVIFDVTERQMNQIKDVIPSGEDVEISQLDGQLPEWAKTVLLKYSQFKM